MLYIITYKKIHIYIVKPALHEHTKAPNHLDTNFRIPPHRSSGHRQFGREYFCIAAKIPELRGPLHHTRCVRIEAADKRRHTQNTLWVAPPHRPSHRSSSQVTTTSTGPRGCKGFPSKGLEVCCTALCKHNMFKIRILDFKPQKARCRGLGFWRCSNSG